MTEAERNRSAQELMSEPATLEAKFLQMEQQMYKGMCQLYRVYCLSEVCNSPLMWSHYAGSHTGICLEFDALAAPFTTSATKVIYRSDLSGL